MSNNNKKSPKKKTGKQKYTYTLKELTEILVKHHGFKEGSYELEVEFKVGVGSFGPSEEEKGPGAVMSIARIGIGETDKQSPLVVDASDLDWGEE